MSLPRNNVYRQPEYTSPMSGVSVQAEDGNVSMVEAHNLLLGNCPRTANMYLCMYFCSLQLSQCFSDRAAQREVLQLEVQCSNKEYGCSWIGRLGDYVDVRTL